jgi:hypothetical protein
MDRGLTRRIITAGIVATGILYLFTVPQTALARGLRNNNPGNLRDMGQPWQGLASPSSDGAFYIFQTPQMGIRAMARVLINYQAKPGMIGFGRSGIDTLTELIARYAPDNENDTNNYVLRVADRTGIDPNLPINVRAELHKIIPAMIMQENGSQPYSNDVINQGIALA